LGPGAWGQDKKDSSCPSATPYRIPKTKNDCRFLAQTTVIPNSANKAQFDSYACAEFALELFNTPFAAAVAGPIAAPTTSTVNCSLSQWSTVARFVADPCDPTCAYSQTQWCKAFPVEMQTETFCGLSKQTFACTKSMSTLADYLGRQCIIADANFRRIGNCGDFTTLQIYLAQCASLLSTCAIPGDSASIAAATALHSALYNFNNGGSIGCGACGSDPYKNAEALVKSTEAMDAEIQLAIKNGGSGISDSPAAASSFSAFVLLALVAVCAVCGLIALVSIVVVVRRRRQARYQALVNDKAEQNVELAIIGDARKDL